MMFSNSHRVNGSDSCCALLVSEGAPAPRDLVCETGSKAPGVGFQQYGREICEDDVNEVQNKNEVDIAVSL